MQDNQFSCPIPDNMQYLNLTCGGVVMPPSGYAMPPGAGFIGNDLQQANAPGSQPSW